MQMGNRNGVSVVLENVSLAFGKHRVLEEISLEIEPGELFAFLGPSGSGKSTLLRVVAGFGPRPGGRVLIDGEDVAALPPWRRNVGMVFQNYALWPHMSVRRNVAFGLEERRLPRGEIRPRVEAALDLVGLLELADRRPSQLSGGQQQRVALARTLVVEPRVLLLDEPLSNLDANLRVRMRKELRELQRRLGITTVFVTHDQEEANTMADRMAVLNEGLLQQVGAPMALYDRPGNRFVAHFLGSANLVEGALAGSSETPVFRADGGIELPAAGASGRRGEVTAMFRPQDVDILPADDTPTGDGRIWLPGRVSDSEFLGHMMRFTVTVGPHRLLVDDEHHLGRDHFAVGEKVRLGLDPSQMRFLPR
jgi:iron(III) transport system ATP-binding protein